jgi:protein arginine kinase activator
MTCDLCEKDACVFLTQIVQGKVHKVSYCETCAEVKGVTDPGGFAFPDVLGSAVGESEDDRGGTRPGRGLICPECGFSEDRLKTVGRFGCGHCYNVFRDQVDHLLMAMHGARSHRGKVPVRFESLEDPAGEIDRLNRRLSEAVEREDYEEAARLRDRLAQLAAESGDAGAPTT